MATLDVVVAVDADVVAAVVLVVDGVHVTVVVAAWLLT